MTKINVIIDGKEVILDEDMLTESLDDAGYYGSVECDICDGGDYITMDIINPENNQKILYNAIIEAVFASYEEAKKELTVTSRYHDWSNTTVDNLISIIEHLLQEADDREAMKETAVADSTDLYLFDIFQNYNKYRVELGLSPLEETSTLLEVYEELTGLDTSWM